MGVVHLYCSSTVGRTNIAGRRSGTDDPGHSARRLRVSGSSRDFGCRVRGSPQARLVRIIAGIRMDKRPPPLRAYKSTSWFRSVESLILSATLINPSIVRTAQDSFLTEAKFGSEGPDVLALVPAKLKICQLNFQISWNVNSLLLKNLGESHF